MDVQGIIDMWNTQMAKIDGRNHTENTVLFILSQTMNEWKQYKEIGTIEDFRRFKDFYENSKNNQQAEGTERKP
jgi:hypothetical protein